MKPIRFSLVLAAALVLVGLSLLPTIQPVVAQGPGTHINSAVFSIYSQSGAERTVRAHRILTSWVESTVTWASFNNNFTVSPLGAFTITSSGWQTLSVTSLVQDWVDNPGQNYGLLLEQGDTFYTHYTSSEDGDAVLNRPKLDVCYTRNNGPETCITIQRPGDDQGDVADAYIWSGDPNYNGGGTWLLFTGQYSDGQLTGEKYSLLRFAMRTPTAVQLQSLSARSSVPPDMALLGVGLAGLTGAVVLRRRREP